LYKYTGKFSAQYNTRSSANKDTSLDHKAISFGEGVKPELLFLYKQAELLRLLKYVVRIHILTLKNRELFVFGIYEKPNGGEVLNRCH
jgi:hypothetical protein